MINAIRGNQSVRECISRNSVRVATLFIIGATAAYSQVYPGGSGGGYPGQYPSQYPGQYPGQGRYPGQTGPSIPIPGRSKKTDTKNSKTANQPLPNFRGTLKVFDEKQISVALGDDRVMDFKRNEKTRFFRNGDEVKSPKFNLGDQVSVEALEESTGYMTAVNVYWEKGAGGTTSKTDDSTYDTWKDQPGSKDQPGNKDNDPDRPVLRRAPQAGDSAAGAKPVPNDKPDSPPETAAPPRREIATESAPPPSRPDPDDPGPPTLRRGGVTDPTRERARPNYPDNPPAAPQVASAAPAPDPARRPVARDERDEDSAPRLVQPKGDDLIRRAADASLEFTQTLPAYVVTEAITRYQSETKPANFHALDVVSTEVVYENGREDYRNITINGKRTTKSMEETGGAWSTGEFGTILINLFSPYTAAQFHYRRDSRVGSITAKLYDFEVERERSSWQIHMGAQSYIPAYSGSIWIDPQTSRVLRIEMEGKGLPETFPIDHVESVTEYAYVRLGDSQQYILPVHSENLSCQRGTLYCSRNVIDFRNYHKYTGESSITFGGDVKDDTAKKKQ